MSQRAEQFGARLVGVDGDLAETQTRAKAYCDEQPQRRCLLPFGLESDEFRDALGEQLTRALSGSSLAPPRRVWLAVGSGTLLRTLGALWPRAEFMPVRVGKNVWEDQFSAELWQRIGGRRRLDELRAVDNAHERLPRHRALRYYRFADAASTLPPYASVDCYDAKLWERLLLFGADGDVVWNVAAI